MGRAAELLKSMLHLGEEAFGNVISEQYSA
jgi:hypothetical protein